MQSNSIQNTDRIIRTNLKLKSKQMKLKHILTTSFIAGFICLIVGAFYKDEYNFFFGSFLCITVIGGGTFYRIAKKMGWLNEEE